MHSDHFPSEKPRTSPAEEPVTDAFDSPEQATDLSDSTGSFIHDGGLQLAENLTQIAKHGPEGINSYLTDVLADTTGSVPSAERAAVFSLLAEQQKLEHRDTLIRGGDQMNSLLAISANNFMNETPGLKSLRIGTENFSNSAQRLRNGNFAPRIIDDAQDSALRIMLTADAISEARSLLTTQQQKALSDFQGTFTGITAKEARMSKVADTFSESYDGEPVDASKLFDPNTALRLARELHSELATQNANPQELIAAKLNVQDDTVQLETIEEYLKLADQYTDGINKMNNDERLDIADARSAFRRFKMQDPRDQRSFSILGGNPEKEREHIATMQNLPRQLVNGINSLEESRKETMRRINMIGTAPLEATTSPTPEAPKMDVREQQPVEPIPEKPIDHVKNEPEQPTVVIEAKTEPIVIPKPEQPEVPQLPQPDYASAKGTKEVINPVAEPVELPAPRINYVKAPKSTPVEQPSSKINYVKPQPVVAETKYPAGYVYTEPNHDAQRRFTESSPADNKGTQKIRQPRATQGSEPKIARNPVNPLTPEQMKNPPQIARPRGQQRPAHPNAFQSPVVERNWVENLDDLKEKSRLAAEERARRKESGFFGRLRKKKSQ